jgi:hypothetical protein
LCDSTLPAVALARIAGGARGVARARPAHFDFMIVEHAAILNEKQAFLRKALARTRYLGPPPPIVPFADWEYYYTKDLLDWKSDENPDQAVSVPAGFVTDLTSIPRIFWAVLPKTGPYTYPAVIHDYLYWFQSCTREEADDVLRTTMVELRVAALKINTIYSAVRLSGGSAWSNNNEARESGEKRVLKRFPAEMTIDWPTWKSQPDVFAD